MLYLYDECITKDLIKSFNPESVENPVVKVIDPESVIGLAAQIQNDEISLPIVAVTRDSVTPIDTDRMNFTRAHIGVQSVLDPETNELYYEKAIPIELSYKLTVLTSNTADMDEIVRELLFKYISMYFLKFTLPYECKRQVRFGIIIDSNTDIERKSSSFEYLQTGELYQSIIPLKCEGCVLVSYTPAKLQRSQTDVLTTNPSIKQNLI